MYNAINGAKYTPATANAMMAYNNESQRRDGHLYNSNDVIKQITCWDVKQNKQNKCKNFNLNIISCLFLIKKL